MNGSQLLRFMALTSTTVFVLAKRAFHRAKNSPVIIPNLKVFKQKLAKLIQGGPKNLQVLADFDRTITSFAVNGQRGMSCHGVIESSGLLSQQYHHHVQGLFHHYYPIEISTLPLSQKVPIMKEWYHVGHQLLLKEDLRRDHLPTAVSTAVVRLRQGMSELFDILEDNKIPLLIFSAGLGDVLEEIIRQQHGKVPDNSSVLSNKMLWGDDGRLIGFSEPLIHMFNKNLTHIKHTEKFQELARRPNVLLLGDGQGDVSMADGIPHDTVLRVGFLNSKVEELLPIYQCLYDVILINDASCSFVNQIVSDVVQNTANL